MALVLGIDTGGTYTDSVVIDSDKRVVICKAKALTTKANLSEGIINSLSELPEEIVRNVSFVALSTTLATNAIVENKRCRTGLILIGTEPEGELPADVIVHLDANINIKGQITKDIDEGELLQVIESMQEQVDVIAVSGFASVRNPIHEQKVKNKIIQTTGLPVVCAHELTGQLADLSFYYALNTDNRINYGPALENIVYTYALSKDYSVSVGRIGKLECDFIMRNNTMDYAYVQVAYTILESKETEDREYRSLENITWDNYPRYLLTTDTLLQKRNGIIHQNLIEFIKEEKDF